MSLLINAAQRVVNAVWSATHRSRPETRARVMKRSFNGAKITNLASGWATTPKPIDVDIRNGLQRLRARARHEAENNDHVRSFLRLSKTNIVGHHGIILQARVKDPDGTQDVLANQSIEAAWSNWGRRGSADVTGLLSWKMIQRLFIETLMRDGEVLIRKILDKRFNKYEFALQFIDVDLLDVDLNIDLPNGNSIRMGVEMDQYRRPVRYHLGKGAGRGHEVIPANQIYHAFLPEWVWQTRGIPPTATALLRLNMLSGYEEAELVAARVAAAKMGFFEERDDDAIDRNNPVMGAGERNDQGEFVTDAEAGSFEVLPSGYTFKPWDPQHPNTAYGQFTRDMLRGIASGLGVNYNAYANDYEKVNFSSLRQGALNERDVWMMMQDWMIEAFCDPVYRDWLKFALTRQVITVMGKPLKDTRFDKYTQIAWQPRRWQWVDPQKEMNAHDLAIRLKVRSPQQVIREQGGDPETVLDEWSQWDQMLKDRNLTMEPATQAGSSIQGDGNATQNQQ